MCFLVLTWLFVCRYYFSFFVLWNCYCFLPISSCFFFFYSLYLVQYLGCFSFLTSFFILCGFVLSLSCYYFFFIIYISFASSCIYFYSVVLLFFCYFIVFFFCLDMFFNYLCPFFYFSSPAFSFIMYHCNYFLQSLLFSLYWSKLLVLLFFCHF